jgi:hypothetical protein
VVSIAVNGFLVLLAFRTDVELTGADRRSYTSYANTQQYKESESITVEFDEREETGRDR